MADQSFNPVGCLGRVLTLLGVIWIGIVVLGSIGLLAEFGLGGGILAWISGTIIPALLLLFAGRALRRRARTMEEQQPALPTTPVPTTPEKKVPTSRPGQPRPILTPPRLPDSPTPQVPAPTREPSQSLDDVIPAREEKPPSVKPAPTRPEEKLEPARPIEIQTKTSREMIEEARRKWGRKE